MNESSWCWNDVRDIVHAKKMNALSVKDECVCCLMMVAEEVSKSNDAPDDACLSLIYEVLCLNSGLLKDNDSSDIENVMRFLLEIYKICTLVCLIPDK